MPPHHASRACVSRTGPAEPLTTKPSCSVRTARLPKKSRQRRRLARTSAKSKKRGHRKPLDPNLPREVVRHELPEAERFCTNDGQALVEISEQLDVIPEQLRVIQHQRVACPCRDLGIKVTPAPLRIIARGLLSEAALAWIATGKYQFGMPLYRQAGLPSPTSMSAFFGSCSRRARNSIDHM